MKLILSLIVTLFAGSLYGQTIQKERYDLRVRQTYYVLMTDTNIKQGPYELRTLYNSVLLCSGRYKNNLKDSLWEYYSHKRLVEKGVYSDDKKTGIWTAYDIDSTIQVQYDYSNKKLLSYKPSTRDSDIFKVYRDDTIEMATLQQPPIYLNGSIMLADIIVWSVHYPRSAMDKLIQGNVIVSFRINSDGRVSDYKITKHLQKDCDNEALRVAKLVSEDWLPGMINGKPVSVEYVLPIKFELHY